MKLNFYSKLLRQAPGEPAGGTPAPVEPVIEAPAGPDLSFIPADYHVDGKPDLAKFSASYQELVARDAQRAEADAAAKANVPEGDYTFALPADLKFDGMELPEGYNPALDFEHEGMKPLLGELSGLLRELRAPQDAAGKLMGLLAKHQATEYAQAVAAQKADIAKLGTPAQVQARVATIGRVLEARLPQEEAAALMGLTSSASALKAIERLLGPSNTTANPAPPSKADDLASYYATPQSKR